MGCANRSDKEKQLLPKFKAIPRLALCEKTEQNSPTAAAYKKSAAAFLYGKIRAA